ncbi:MAG: hypothetical protein AAGE84_16070 [Cyanobacteria bacterium P01_G01_bin.39]
MTKRLCDGERGLRPIVCFADSDGTASVGRTAIPYPQSLEQNN